MITQPRPVEVRTIFEVAKRNRNLFIFGPMWLFASIIIGSTFPAIVTSINNDVPTVDHSLLLEAGVPTMGIITGIEEQVNVIENGRHPLNISYRYFDNGIETESRFKTLAPDEVSRLSLGDSIPIKYLNGQSIIAAMAPYTFPIWPFVLIFGVFFGSGLAATIYVASFTRNKILLYKYGKVTDATVLSATRNWTVFRLFGKVDDLRINYQYRGDSGRTHIAAEITRDLTLVNTIKAGDLIKTFVSPYDESKSTLIPRVEAARNNWNID